MLYNTPMKFRRLATSALTKIKRNKLMGPLACSQYLKAKYGKNIIQRKNTPTPNGLLTLKAATVDHKSNTIPNTAYKFSMISIFFNLTQS
jgi:hypothetical protein